MNDHELGAGAGEPGGPALDDGQARALLHRVRPTVAVDEGWARLQDELRAGERAGHRRRRHGSRPVAPVATVPAGQADDVVVVDAGSVPGSRSRLPRWYRGAAAAGVAAAVLLATVLVWRTAPDGGPAGRLGTGTDPSGSTIPPTPSPTHVVPSWIPDGLVLWGADVPVDGLAGVPNPPPSAAERAQSGYQLFRPAGAATGGILLEHRPDTIVGSVSPTVTVRGTTGYRSPTGALGADFSISWNEPSATPRSMRASVQGVSDGEALAMLDALVQPAGDPEADLQLPSTSTWRLDGTAEGWFAPTRRTSLVYDRSVPSAAALRVVTTRDQGAGSLLTARFAGTPRPDGGFEVLDTERQTFQVNWPNGDEVRLTGPPALSLDDDHRVVDGRRTVESAEIEALVRQASAARVTLPLIASVPVGPPAGRIDIRGEGPSVVACAVFGAEPVVCSQNDLPGTPSGSPAAGAITVGSTWYAFAAAKDDRELLFHAGTVYWKDLPTTRAAGSGWITGLAPVPDGVDLISVTEGDPGGRGGRALTLARPGRF